MFLAAGRCLLLSLLLVAGCGLCGCAPLVLTAGAGAGYVATHEEPRSKVETFFDDLGRSIRQTTRRLTGAPPPRRSAAVRTGNPVSLRIVGSSLSPAKVRPGEQVSLRLEYLLAGGGEAAVQVRETSTLIRNGRQLAVLRDEREAKETGTWENTLTFAVPASAEPGLYTVALQVSAGRASRVTRRSFRVQ